MPLVAAVAVLGAQGALSQSNADCLVYINNFRASCGVPALVYNSASEGCVNYQVRESHHARTMASCILWHIQYIELRRHMSAWVGPNFMPSPVAVAHRSGARADRRLTTLVIRHTLQAGTDAGAGFHATLRTCGESSQCEAASTSMAGAVQMYINEVRKFSSYRSVQSAGCSGSIYCVLRTSSGGSV